MSGPLSAALHRQSGPLIIGHRDVAAGISVLGLISRLRGDRPHREHTNKPVSGGRPGGRAREGSLLRAGGEGHHTPLPCGGGQAGGGATEKGSSPLWKGDSLSNF